MKTVFISMNKKWEIQTAPGNGSHKLRILETTRNGRKDIEFRTMEEFWAADPFRLDVGKNKDVPKSVVQAAEVVAQTVVHQSDHGLVKVYEMTPTSMRIGADVWELRGSHEMDFVPFMRLLSEGAVTDMISYFRYCDMCAEEGEDLDAASYDTNFGDLWADYRRKWAEANPQEAEGE